LQFGSPREKTFSTWFFSTMAAIKHNKEASANTDYEGVLSSIEAEVGLNGQLDLAILEVLEEGYMPLEQFLFSTIAAVKRQKSSTKLKTEKRKKGLSVIEEVVCAEIGQFDLAIKEVLDDHFLQTSDTQEKTYGPKQCSKTPPHSVSMCPKPKGEVLSPMEYAPKKRRSSQMEPSPAPKKRRMARTNLRKKTHTEEKSSEEKGKLTYGLNKSCLREDQELNKCTKELEGSGSLFICVKCSANFTNKEDLQMHAALHAAERNSTRIKAPKNYREV